MKLSNWLRQRTAPKTLCRHLIRPTLQRLEDRLAPAVITVTGTGDNIAVDGQVTLREAMTSANNNSNVNADVVANGAYGTDTIQFHILGSGVQTISPGHRLPPIIDPVIIDGYTQPGASPNTLAVGDNAVLLIAIDARPSNLSNPLLEFNGGNQWVVRGLDLELNAQGIVVDNGNASSQLTIAGNFIGTDPTGSTAAFGSGEAIQHHYGDGRHHWRHGAGRPQRDRGRRRFRRRPGAGQRRYRGRELHRRQCCGNRGAIVGCT